MQKKLIAIAIATAFSAPAFADVTVYGKVDAGYGSLAQNAISTAGADTTKTTTSAIGFSQFFTSRIGFKAKEDLGNGMSAATVVESGINAGPTSIGDREMNVALTIDGTTIKGGYGSPEVRNIAYGYDAMYGSNMIGNLLTDTKHKNGLSTDLTARTVSLGVSRDLGGVDAGVSLMKNTKDVSGDTTAANNGANDTGTGYELFAKYAQDALKVAFGYSSAKTTTASTTPTDATTKSMILGATYDLGVAKLAAQYANVKKDDNKTAANSTKATGYSLGAYLPVNAAATVYVQYSGAKDEGTNTDAKSTGYAVGVKYDLSKATFVYVDFGGTKQDHSTKGSGSTGYKQSQYALGIVQSF